MRQEKISQFPGFTKIGIQHKDTVQDIFSAENPEISQLNFVELYAWRKTADIKMAEIDGGIVFSFDKKGEKFLTPPAGSRNFGAATEKILVHYKETGENLYIKGFTDSMKEKLGPDAEKFVFEENRDDADYVYKVKDLADLKGRKFDGKRNHIKKFNKLYKYEFPDITPETLPEVIEFQERWCALKPCDDDLSLRDENTAVAGVLEEFFSLPVFGAAIKINGRVEAYTFASEMNPEMAAVIAEKANWEFKGIYQAINKMFNEKLMEKYKWVNRQQDAGGEGLRKAKMSYNPHHLIRKYKVKLK